MDIILIIQARLGSKRLPGKILKSLGTQDVLSYNVTRCNEIVGISKLIVATSDLSQDDAIVDWCNTHQVAVFRGSEDDVLDRYVQCASLYQPDYVMRVTSDCPFVDYELASNLVHFINEHPVEIVDLVGELPRGLAVEVISFAALKRIHQLSTEPRHREHVTYYAYEYPEQFTRVAYPVPSTHLHPDLRITLDTKEDYELLQAVAHHFNDPLVSSVDVINYLLEHPEVAALNAHIEQKPVI